MPKNLHLLSLLAALILATPQLSAQSPEDLAQLDPAELYFQAWSLVQEGKELEDKNDFINAFGKYKKARSFFDIIKATQPNFRTEALNFRLESTNEAMEKVHPKALEQQKAQQQKQANSFLEVPGETSPQLTIPPTADQSGDQSARIRELQNEINKLKSDLAQRPNQRDIVSARLRERIEELQSEMLKLAAAPLRDHVAELNAQIERLRRERDAMAHARDQAIAEQQKTLRQLETTQTALAQARAEETRLLQLIAKQSEINGRLAEGQEAQIQALKATIAEKDSLLKQSQQAQESLQQQLTQANQMVTELRDEQEKLLTERSQMQALLKMNEADRVQELITQNVNLSKELNEAKANLELVQSDADASKDSILQAKQALVIAKTRIQNLQKTATQSQLQIEQLQKRLNQAEDDLLAQLNGENLNKRGRDEVTMLRQVIDKLKAKINAQQGAAELLIKQGERIAQLEPEEENDPTENQQNWKDAIARVKGEQNVELTLEEMELLERTALAPSFTNDSRPSAEELNDGVTRLRDLTRDLNQVSRRLFAKGDFQAARGNLQLIVDEDPGAWEAMINLGIVQLRLDDPISAAKQFKQAILVAGDRKIPFAHFINGDALYRQGLYDEAASELRNSLTLDPENPSAHIILGNIAGKTNQYDEAEFHFKEAIAQDATLIEPYANMAILSLRRGQLDLARQYYQDYLAKGGPPRPALEQQLKP